MRSLREIVAMVVLVSSFFPPEVAESSPRRVIRAIRVTPRNASRFELLSGGTVCYLPPKRSERVAGRFVLHHPPAAKGREPQRYFVRARVFAEWALRRIRKNREISGAELRERARRILEEFRAQKEICSSDARQGGSHRVRLRWFPVEEAEGYMVYVERSDREVIRKIQVRTAGCSHLRREGFTAGICWTEIPTEDLSGAYRLRVAAFNSSGESERSGPILS